MDQCKSIFRNSEFTSPLNLVGISGSVGLGDVNNDGVDDFAICSLSNWWWQAQRGRVVIISGDRNWQVPVTEPSNLTPVSFDLSVYPNPFNPTTTISFILPRAGEVKLAMYDVLGRNVGKQPFAATKNYSAGEHHLSFDGSGLSSGIYFVRLEAGGNVQTRKMMLLR